RTRQPPSGRPQLPVARHMRSLRLIDLLRESPAQARFSYMSSCWVLVTLSAMQWVVTAYALTFGGFLLLGGRAADLLGRRRILMVGLAVFTAASLACGLATSEVFLIGSRAVQGLGAAIMLPAALSIVMNMFEEGAERNKALGVWGAIAGGGATV